LYFGGLFTKKATTSGMVILIVILDSWTVKQAAASKAGRAFDSRRLHHFYRLFSDI
jgi:hypothetical protein